MPTDLQASTVILRSDLLTITNKGDNPAIFHIVTDKQKVESLKLLSRWDVTCMPSSARYLDLTVDTSLVLNIRYVLAEPTLLILELYSNVIKIRLREPVQASHLSSLMVVNEPITEEEGKSFGIIAFSLYTTSEEEWDSIPVHACRFSMMGSHIGPDRGLYSTKEHRLAQTRSQLVMGSAKEVTHPWHVFMKTEERLNNQSSSLNIPEFMYYNEAACFDKCIRWDYDNKTVCLGRGSRIGLFYWKYAHSLPSLQVNYSLSLLNSIYPIAMWWISTMALPNYDLISTIFASLENHIRNSSDAASIDISYVVQSPLIGIVINKEQDGTVRFRYVYLTVRPRNPETDESLSQSLQAVPVLSVSTGIPITLEDSRDMIALQLSVFNNTLSVQVNGQPMRHTLPLPSLLSSQAVTHAIAGVAGRSAMLSKYEVSSDSSSSPSSSSSSSSSSPSPSPSEISPSYLLLPSTDLVIYKAASMYKKLAFNTTPCSVVYRDHVSYGSTDPLLNDPPTYTMEGHVFALDAHNKAYGVLASSLEQKAMCFIELYADASHGSSSIAVHRGLNCSVKRMAERPNTEVSCFTNNRFQRFESGRGGLVNYSNTCFQNSTIQFLFHSDIFKRSLLQFYTVYRQSGLSCDNDNFRCVEALVQMITRLQVSIRAGEFNSLMLVLQKQFDLGYQHVCDE